MNVSLGESLMQRIVDAVKLVEFLRAEASEAFEGDLNLFVQRFIEHGGTEEELDMVLGDLTRTAGEDKSTPEEMDVMSVEKLPVWEFDKDEGPSAMSIDELKRLMGE